MSLEADALDGDKEQLILRLDHEDPLVAYAAKEHLQRVVSVGHESDEWIRLLLTKSDQGQWRSSSGYRFQTLRCLLNRDCASDECEADSGEDAPSSADSASTASSLEGIFSHFELVRKITLGVFSVSDEQCRLEPTVCLEALGFLCSMLKGVMASSIATDTKLLGKVDHLMLDVASSLHLLDFGELPTFLSCAILDFLGDYQALLDSQAANTDTLDQDYSLRKGLWTQCCAKLLLQSSCSPVVLQLLRSDESSDTSCAHSFIALQSRYPLLQHWIRFSSNLLVSALSNDISAMRLETESITFCCEELPSRMQLLEIVSEQDDVLVDMLNALLQSSTLLHGIKTPVHREAIASFIKYMNEQLDSDLLFSDTVAKLGDDHLVILDLLISSETSMLEYLMRYLRYLASAWSRSSGILKSHDRLESAMDVLIRLRLEIEKLNDAGIFPYNPSPLLRRLHEIERLYENEER